MARLWIAGEEAVEEDDRLPRRVCGATPNFHTEATQPRTAGKPFHQRRNDPPFAEMRGQLITTKKLEPTPAERNRVDMKLARKAHAEWLIAEDPHLIYIDESGFNLWTSRTRGRS